MTPLTLCLLLTLLSDTPAAPPTSGTRPAAAVAPTPAAPLTDEELIRERLERARLRYRLLSDDLPARRKAWREQLDALRRRIDLPAPVGTDPSPEPVAPRPLPPAPPQAPEPVPTAGAIAPAAAASTLSPARYDDLANDLERLATQAHQLVPRLRTAAVPRTAGCPAASSR